MADSGSVDKATGKVKKAAGELTDDQDLKNEGRVDKASGSLKSAVDKAKDALHRD
jgi:uncharacterized protein YjbJ (UPF0337 family)